MIVLTFAVMMAMKNYAGGKYDPLLQVAVPYGLLIARAAGPGFSSGHFFALVVLLAQFPAYGLTLGAAASRGRLVPAALWVGCVHALAAGICVALPF